MFISAIQRFPRVLRTPLVPTVFYGRADREERPPEPSVSKQPRFNRTGLSGGLALTFMGLSAVTGIAHARVPHMISSALAIVSTLFHIESIAPHRNKSHNYVA